METHTSESIIAERYQLAELLGEGGSGSTYRAIRLDDGAQVAIKILSLRHLNDWKQLELFEREAKVLSQLDHPQIPKYLEYFYIDTPENRAFYIVQQLAPGKSLNAWVQSGWRGTEAEIRDLAAQLLGILQYLHRQSPPLIHRDIKPHNIIRDDDGRVFLVDFGSVQDVYRHTLLKGATVAGTYGYMSLEQFRGEAMPASDLYGLGATILYLLTHRSPADLPQERLKLNFRSHVNISENFADWLEVMLEPDTSDRFAATDLAIAALAKKHRFRKQQAVNIGFPWKGTAIAITIAAASMFLLDRSRYPLFGFFGLKPSDRCTSIESADYYLNRGDNNENKTVKERATSLLACAISENKADLVALLLSKGADPNPIVDKGGRTPIEIALSQFRSTANPTENKQIISWLSERTTDPDRLMFAAVEYLNQDVFDRSLKLGANPGKVDDNGSYLIHKLIASDRYAYADSEREVRGSILKFLIDRRVDLNVKDADGYTPIHRSVYYHDLLLTEQLLAANIDVNTSNRQGRTPLMDSWSEPITLALLKAGAKVNARENLHGNTYLMMRVISYTKSRKDASDSAAPSIAFAANLNVISALLDRGAAPNLPNFKGEFPLRAIARSMPALERAPNADECVEYPGAKNELLALLIQHGANLNLRDRRGNTALHIAAQHGDLEYMQQLIAAGANPLLENRYGTDAVEMLFRTKYKYFAADRQLEEKLYRCYAPHRK